MADDRFPYEKCHWKAVSAEQQRLWYEALERTGTDGVRIQLMQVPGSSNASFSVGGVPSMTKGFAEEWLAWHERQKTERETRFRARQIFWTRWAAFAASGAATVAIIGWAITILLK